MITSAMITQAQSLLSSYISPSPTRSVATLNTTDKQFIFKLENTLAPVHSFKIRGALYTVLTLTEEERSKGLITFSSGNHGAAVAWIGHHFHIPVTIIVPETISQKKLHNITRFGAQIISCPMTQRENTLRHIIEEQGGTVIHPFNDLRVITGQATVAMEFLQEHSDLQAIVVPVGGGGLLSGTVLTAHHYAPEVIVLGAEPALTDDTYRSLEANTLLTNTNTNSIADALCGTLGSIPFSILSAHRPTIITVGEDSIIQARHTLETALQLPVEPSSAIAYAAALQSTLTGKIGIVLSGGNVETVSTDNKPSSVG